ncbi:MAG: hypothetical protein DMG65_09970 [Candidatus Angelobacter sp. Gp1-AA117]|nr:MAG: hypothetical protein DMG65_09970 [Candidatus Angelobacter sp. Gp1-AA117]
MSNILEKMADSFGPFRPAQPREYLALQIAKRLNDLQSVRHYAVLFEHHPEDRLIDIYRRCAKEGQFTGEAFMFQLREIN